MSPDEWQGLTRSGWLRCGRGHIFQRRSNDDAWRIGGIVSQLKSVYFFRANLVVQFGCTHLHDCVSDKLLTHNLSPVLHRALQIRRGPSPGFSTVQSKSGFQSNVYLPGSSPVSQANGLIMPRKDLARASACLAAVKALYQVGFILRS